MFLYSILLQQLELTLMKQLIFLSNCFTHGYLCSVSGDSLTILGSICTWPWTAFPYRAPWAMSEAAPRGALAPAQAATRCRARSNMCTAGGSIPTKDGTRISGQILLAQGRLLPLCISLWPSVSREDCWKISGCLGSVWDGRVQAKMGPDSSDPCSHAHPSSHLCLHPAITLFSGMQVKSQQ